MTRPTSRTAGSRTAGVSLAVLLDVAERATLVLLFARLLLSNYQAVLTTGHWFNWLLVLSEGLGVFFIMTRKRAMVVSQAPFDWIVAFLATAGPLLVQPAGFRPLAPVGVGVALLLIGLAGQVTAKLSLGRSFGVIPANRGVKVGGPYRYVRHPMYLGYLCVHIGFLILTPSLWNLGVYAFSIACQVARILAEERLLSRDPRYADFQSTVRYRLVPGVF